MKRFLDILISGFGLVAAVPLLLVSSFCILVSMGRPVFFGQKRPGLNGKIFKLHKLRTMQKPSRVDEATSSASSRITPLGHFLRRYSIDELPQLWNVLKGDMSLVGPRPLLVEYLPLYSPEQARRHEVRPGLTGWAQVNGRNAISWDEKFALDVWYVDNQSNVLDMRILWLTLQRLNSYSDINANAETTMARFKGSASESAREAQ
jgi:lipopolysaccharide/colanic/teichoic acid biosynthesis glycosyltransferase